MFLNDEKGKREDMREKNKMERNKKKEKETDVLKIYFLPGYILCISI